tara:strand:- start:1432 stop:1695 length:264 start_codon:yes stop_codon:yes gene_type:complete
MNIKSVVLGEITKQVEASIPELQKGIEVLVIDTIQSKEFEKEWATAINKKINLPGLNERAEQVLFEKMIDKGTDIVAGIMSKLLKAK